MPLSDEPIIRNYDVLRAIRRTMLEMRNRLLERQCKLSDDDEPATENLTYRIEVLDRKIDAITTRLKRGGQPLETPHKTKEQNTVKGSFLPKVDGHLF